MSEIDVMEKINKNQKLQQIWLPRNQNESSFVDDLTGLPNRNLLLQKLQDNIAFCKEHSNKTLALLVLDIDHFKVVNNSLGIAVGDQLLIKVAERLQDIMRFDDYVVRLGGDEFAVVLNNIKDIDNIHKIASRIHDGLMLPFCLNDNEVFINTSMGITHSHVSFGKAEDFFRDADTAMNYAKSLGRSCRVIFQPEMHKSVVQRLNLGNSLRQALSRKEFFLEYQPIVSLDEEILVGFEALIRWKHPQQGTIPPSEFIHLAEEIGLIEPIGQWALEEACQQTKAWQVQFEGMQDLTISVNLSAKQIFDNNFFTQVKTALAKSELEPCCLKLEVTENILLEDKKKVAAVLDNVRSLGVQISIDDFGTGYSSLSYLMHFPFDVLKLDTSFTEGIDNNYKKFNLVKGILTLSQGLEVEVVAEGLETQDQLLQFKALKCRYGQGYIFSKPLSKQKVESFILSNLIGLKNSSLERRTCLFHEQLDISQKDELSRDELLIKIENLKFELKELKQEKKDFEILLETAESHAEVIEHELHQEIFEHQSTELKLQVTNHQLQQLSYIDGLTKVANRRHFDEYLCQAWKCATKEQKPISLILADVDFFKRYNDKYGHQVGDYCLVRIAQALAKIANRSADLTARYGGEEFALILPESSPERAVEVAENIRSAVKSLKILNPHSSVNDYVTISSGIVSVVPQDFYSLSDFIGHTDKALYNAKNRGRDCFNILPW